MADVGFEPAAKLLTSLRAKVRARNTTDPAVFKDILREELAEIFHTPKTIKAVNPPEVVMERLPSVFTFSNADGPLQNCHALTPELRTDSAAAFSFIKKPGSPNPASCAFPQVSPRDGNQASLRPSSVLFGFRRMPNRDRRSVLTRRPFLQAGVFSPREFQDEFFLVLFLRGPHGRPDRR